MMDSSNRAPDEQPLSVEAANSEGKLLSMKSPAWDKVRQMALRQLDRMLSLEPKVLRGDHPGAIHDFRVASRRFQTALSLLSLPSEPPEIRRIRRKVRRGRRACSAVRNCDVFLARIEKLLAGRRPSSREAWMAVLDHVRRRRDKAHKRALRKLSKLNLAHVYVDLRPALVSGAQDFSGSHEASAEALQNLIHVRMREELNRTSRRFAAEAAHFQSGSGADALHPLRLATKKLRYVIEVADELQIQGSREILAWLRKTQQHLGDCHDLEVAQQMMAKMAAHPGFLLERLDLAMQILKLISRERNAKERAGRRCSEWLLATGGSEALSGQVESLLANRNETTGVVSTK